MSFFDDLTKKAKVVASAASEKAKEAADTAKISAAIVAEKRELDKKLRALGSGMSASTLMGRTPAAVADLVAAVKASQEKIAQLQACREQMAEAGAEPQGKVCPVCGKISESKFCPTAAPPWRRISDAKRTPGRWSFGRGFVFS